jgi:hypothetical protein
MHMVLYKFLNRLGGRPNKQHNFTVMININDVLRLLPQV